MQIHTIKRTQSHTDAHASPHAHTLPVTNYFIHFLTIHIAVKVMKFCTRYRLTFARVHIALAFNGTHTIARAPSPPHPQLREMNDWRNVLLCHGSVVVLKRFNNCYSTLPTQQIRRAYTQKTHANRASERVRERDRSITDNGITRSESLELIYLINYTYWNNWVCDLMHSKSLTHTVIRNEDDDKEWEQQKTY